MANWLQRIWRGATEERMQGAMNPYSLIAAMPSAAGPVVTEENAMRAGAVFACVRIIAESIASLPLHLYERSGRNRARASGHGLYPLLHDLANAEMTAFEWRETAFSHACLWGNHWSEIEYDRRGAPVALWPLRPDRMEGWERREDGVWWLYRLPDQTQRWIPAFRLHHIRTMGDGVMGYSPVRTAARQAIGLALATEEFGARFFSNGARPGLLIRHPGKLSPGAYERLRASFSDMHQGLSNAHRARILEEGMDIATIGIPPDEAQFLETRKFQVTEIARIFRVPPHMLADLDRATFSNIEHQSLEFVMHTLRPWLVRHEQAIQRDLLRAADRNRYFARYAVDGLLRGDTATRYQAYTTGIQTGFLTRNEARELEDLNPIAGLDAPLVPLNMMESGASGPAARQLSDAELRPTAPMREEAQRGLDWRAEYGRGGTAVGVARARDIVNDRVLSEDTWRRMFSFFARHEVNKEAEGFRPGEAGYPSAGRIAWALWGGDPGYARARAIVARLDAEEEERVGESDHDVHGHARLAMRPEVSEPGGWSVREERIRRDRQAMMRRHTRLWEDATERAVKRETADIRRAVARHLAQRSVESFDDWLERFYTDMREWLPAYFRALLLASAEEVLASVATELDGEPVPLDDRTRAWIEAYLATFAMLFTVGHSKQLRALLAESDPEEVATVVSARLDGWMETQPQKTAMEQAVQAANGLILLAYERSDVRFIRWSARGESCPFCRRLDGRRIPIDGAFADEGEEVEGDGESGTLPMVRRIRHGPLHGGCDCTVLGG